MLPEHPATGHLGSRRSSARTWLLPVASSGACSDPLLGKELDVRGEPPDYSRGVRRTAPAAERPGSRRLRAAAPRRERKRGPCRQPFEHHRPGEPSGEPQPRLLLRFQALNQTRKWGERRAPAVSSGTSSSICKQAVVGSSPLSSTHTYEQVTGGPGGSPIDLHDASFRRRAR